MNGDFPDIPYVEAAHFGAQRSKTKIVVMHATDNTATDEGEVSFQAHRSDSVSAHFTNDEDSIYQGVPLVNIAYGCLWHGNQMSVQFEQCGISGHLSDLTMRTSAAVVRRVCQKYNIPMKKIGPAEVRAAWYSDGPGGICGHADVTAAFPEDHGDHTDPGWDEATWQKYISYVRGQGEGDDMLIAAVVNGNYFIGDGIFHRRIIDWPEHQALIPALAVEKSFTSEWAAFGVLGRIDADKLVADVGGPQEVQATLSDAQVDRIAAAVIARPDTPLSDADKPAIVAAVKEALREGSGA